MSTTQHESRSQRESHDTFAERFCGHVADAALIGSVILVPCLLGGRIALGQFALAACAAIAAFAWSAGILFSKRPTWHVTWIEPLLLAVIGLGLLQITPLPPELLRIVSPHHHELLPLWSASAGSAITLGEWQTLSLSLDGTRGALIVGLSYIALFYVATQRIRRIHDVERMMRWVASAAAGMALFGVVQWLSNNGKFFWFYEYPLTNSGNRLKGAFTNRNHFAHFLVLGCGPLLWWVLKLLEDRSSKSASFGSSHAVQENRDTLLAALLLGLGVLVFGVLFSLSRGGMVALAVSLLVMLGALLRIGVLSARVVGVLLGIAAISGSLFLMLGYDKVSDRLDNWQSDSRLAIWQANLQIARDFPLFGSGLGSHVEAYPMYFDPPFTETEFTHAESSYLQVASESGLLGIGLALLSLTCFAMWCLRSLLVSEEPRVRMLAAALTASLAANAVHAVFDFVWYVPGLMTVLLILAACARRLDQLSQAELSVKRSSPVHKRDSVRSVPRGLGLLTAVATLGVVAWSYPQLVHVMRGESSWFEYLKLAQDKDPDEAKTTNNDDIGLQPQAPDDATIALFKRRVAALNQTTKLNPQHARAHLRLTTAYLNAFEHLQTSSENPMTLAQLRDAAFVSQFADVEAMREWLQRAVGPNLKYLDAASRHAKQAVQLCPLQGQAYVYLAELLFLEDLDSKHPQALLHQAELVRPQSAQVQFVVGREALLDGRTEDALKAWKLAFHRDRSYQDQILLFLAGNIPTDVILDHLEPDLPALERMERHYRNLAPSHYVIIARAYANALIANAQDPKCPKPVDEMLKGANLYAKLNDLPSAESGYRKALEFDRTSMPVRRAYGLFLFEQNRFAASLEHLEWCLQMAPSDQGLRRLVDNAKMRNLRQDSAIQPAIGYESWPRKRRGS